MILHQYDDTPCPGMNCGTTDGKHSKECIAEHTAACAGGFFGKWMAIETAPREIGQNMLLHGDGTSIENCSYVGEWNGHGFVMAWGDNLIRPTHWMPLPAPPVPNK